MQAGAIDVMWITRRCDLGRGVARRLPATHIGQMGTPSCGGYFQKLLGFRTQ
jgi:hypothetical protein